MVVRAGRFAETSPEPLESLAITVHKLIVQDDSGSKIPGDCKANQRRQLLARPDGHVLKSSGRSTGLHMFGSEVRCQRNRTVSLPGEGSERVRDGAGQGAAEMGRAFRLGAFNLAQESERAALHVFTLTDLRSRKSDCLLLLRETFCSDVPSDQVQLTPGVVHVVRALFQLQYQTIDSSCRSGGIELYVLRQCEHRIVARLVQSLLEERSVDRRELSSKHRRLCVPCRQRGLGVRTRLRR